MPELPEIRQPEMGPITIARTGALGLCETANELHGQHCGHWQNASGKPPQ